MSNDKKDVAVETNKPVTTVINSLELLGQKATPAEIIEKVNELVSKVNSIKVRDRGPKSERAMTEDDARRIKFGDLAGLDHKEAAAKLGLSYGQVYSCRGGYTFTYVKKDGKSS